MFLKSNVRKKDGKEHEYWSIVENRRVGRRIVQRQVLYLGEINASQKESWLKVIDVVESGAVRPRQIALFAEGRAVPVSDTEIIQVRLKDIELHRPRQWGGCWLACELWRQLHLDEFWSKALPASRKGTRWKHVLQTLVCYRLLDPGSEWRLHRLWYERSAMGDLLGENVGLVEINKLYRCMDKLLQHKRALFSFLHKRWEDLFQPRFDILLYDLTSTYFECSPPKEDKRQFGYSRDKRSDCLQVVIALVVTPEGFPLAYEVLPGNTSDKTTLKDFLKKIEEQYGKANRIWVMDRGIPTEEVLAQMRSSEPPVFYLVGTPRAKLNKLETSFSKLPWEKVRQAVEVKLLQDGELYVLARSKDRAHKERGIRQRRLRKFWKRLQELQRMKLTRDQLLLKLGAAQKEARQAAGLVSISLPSKYQKVSAQTFFFALDKEKLRAIRKKEGSYLLRSNLTAQDPVLLWNIYLLLTEIEQAFKNLKSDLVLRPIFHKLELRIEAHIFIAFMAYCLHVTLKQRLRSLAPGLTPRAVLDKLSAIQMIDVHLPTTDNRQLIMPRYTQPEKDILLLLAQLKLHLPPQPPPKVVPFQQKNSRPKPPFVVETSHYPL